MTTLPKRRTDYHAVQDDDGSWRPIKQHDVARGLLTCKEVCAMFGAGARAGTAVRMSSMVELVVAVVGLVSACIFLAHAIEAYRA